jgi:phage repressor protein C with HTH and peptisase S24 domain
MPGWTYFVGLIALVALALLAARRALVVVRISGPSMLPTFKHGDAVLAVKRGLSKRLRPGDIVVCRLPPGVRGPDSLVIKRIRELDGDAVFLVGDGPRSYDSRQFGPIAAAYVVGRVVAHLHL